VDIDRLWRAYAISSLGTWLALDAFPLIAIRVLHSSAAAVSMLAAVTVAAGALLAVPLGPWVEARPKRGLMIRADWLRFGALLTVPLAYLLGALTYPQLMIVAVVVAVADIVFVGASGAYLKAVVSGPDLLRINARFETAGWISTAIGPPAGGALIGVLGPVITVVLNATSFALSALNIRRIATPSPAPAHTERPSITGGWRAILTDPVLRVLLGNNALVSALIMATAPLLAYRMLHDLGFTPLEYGLGFGVPCLGGILGSRLSRPLAHRYGQRRILLIFGVGRVLWSIGLAFIGPGLTGLLLVMAVELGLITCMGVYSPVFATYRLERIEPGTAARALTAWTITTRTSVAAGTALWGGLAAITGVRPALIIAGALLLATAVLLPWFSPADRPAVDNTVIG
jgi:MFS-type transporter involved in bile tolerance (Atg22 family)